ncbi:MAG: RNA-binding protein [Mangrovicoccus sp.]|nr:RNA-binding protein [Mangrovicoccus sp.]
MTRGGRAKTNDAPERRCIITGESGPKAGLLRFVVAPDGVLVADLLGRLPGRGIWITSSRAALDQASRKGAFSRAARQKLEIPEGLADQVEQALSRRVIDLISLARKAGLAVGGYEKVKGWLDTGRAEILVQACDGSDRGRSKLRPPAGPETLISVLTASELGFAFGRENVIHAALATGGLTTRVVEDAARLSGLRVEIDGNLSVGKGNTAL